MDKKSMKKLNGKRMNWNIMQALSVMPKFKKYENFYNGYQQGIKRIY